MNNKQQTSVEWFYEEMITFLKLRSKYSTDREIFKQAKEMEKEKLKEAWNKGEDCGLGRSNYEFENADDYYNETYGGIK